MADCRDPGAAIERRLTLHTCSWASTEGRRQQPIWDIHGSQANGFSLFLPIE